MLDSIAALCVRRARLVLALAALAVIAAALIGSGAAALLSNGGTTDPSADSSLAANALSQHFASGTPNLVLVTTVTDGSTVDSPAATAAGDTLAGRLAAQPGVQGVASYWQTKSPELRSGSGDVALITAHLTGSDDAVAKTIADLAPKLQGASGDLKVQVTGAAEIRRESDNQIKKDLAKAEAVAVPLILICLLFVFRSLIAALLPLVIGAVSIPGTMLVLRLLTAVTPVSVFAMNLTTALGLGLGIDYSLLVVRRYREELNRRQDVPEAIRAALRTAGRTVVISALTVAGAMAALLVFPLYFLRSFAYAGSAVVLLAALAVVVVLPALLAVVGYRINALNVTNLFRGRAAKAAARSSGAASPVPSGRAWYALATAVMRRPLLVAAAVTAILVVLALPFRHVSFGLADDRVLPANAQAAVAAQTIRADFGSAANSDIQVYASNVPGNASAADGELADYAARLSKVPGIDRVESAAGTFAAGASTGSPTGVESAMLTPGGQGWLQLVPTVAASQSTDALVRGVRATGAPFPVLVGGAPAQLLDTKAAVERDLPLAVGIIAAVTFVLMFLLTGSLLVPVKALILNLLSLTATFGSLVWVFQYGHLRFLLGDFQVAGFLDLTIPILMFCVSFGMSMDYEAALMSRIREE
ncbi:MAG: MMPL family transporter, partial [Actinocrinis sp.]